MSDSEVSEDEGLAFAPPPILWDTAVVNVTQRLGDDDTILDYQYILHPERDVPNDDGSLKVSLADGDELTLPISAAPKVKRGEHVKTLFTQYGRPAPGKAGKADDNAQTLKKLTNLVANRSARFYTINFPDMGTPSPDLARLQNPKIISFQRRKELMAKAMNFAGEIIEQKVQPHELRLFLSTISTLLDKNEYC